MFLFSVSKVTTGFENHLLLCLSMQVVGPGLNLKVRKQHSGGSAVVSKAALSASASTEAAEFEAGHLNHSLLQFSLLLNSSLPFLPLSHSFPPPSSSSDAFSLLDPPAPLHLSSLDPDLRSRVCELHWLLLSARIIRGVRRQDQDCE